MAAQIRSITGRTGASGRFQRLRQAAMEASLLVLRAWLQRHQASRQASHSARGGGGASATKGCRSSAVAVSALLLLRRHGLAINPGGSKGLSAPTCGDVPAAGFAVDVLSGQLPFSQALHGKWFVIWSVEGRLVTAELRQILQPRYTARVILSLKSEDFLVLFGEPGFANLAIGMVRIFSAFAPSWRPAGAVAGGVFFGLADVNSALRAHRSLHETIAMVSDLLVAVVLLASMVPLVGHHS